MAAAVVAAVAGVDGGPSSRDAAGRRLGLSLQSTTVHFKVVFRVPALLRRCRAKMRILAHQAWR